MIKKLIASLMLTATIYAGGNLYTEQEMIQDPCLDRSGMYVGVSVSYDEFSMDYFPSPNGGDYDEFGPGIQLTIGYDIFGFDNWLYSVEGRIGYASVEDIDYSWYAAYTKVEYDAGKFGIYGLLGYGTSDATLSIYNGPYNIKINGSVNDFTYGAGINYQYSDELSIVLDYVVEPEFVDDNINNDVISLGVNYKFKGL